MAGFKVTVDETVTDVSVVDDVTLLNVSEAVTVLSESVAGVQGPTGATGATGATGTSGVVGVDSGELTNTGTSSAAQLGLATAGTAGTYTKVTTDTFGRVTTGATLILGDLPAGVARTGSANAFTVGGHTITNGAVGTIPLSFVSAVSQTANMVEWKASNGTSIMALVDAYGNAVFGGNNTLGSSLGIQTGGSTTQKGITVRGAASQSADLQQWQNSAGSVIANITAAGGLAANFYNSTGGQFLLTYSNSGGNLRMLRATAAATSPGANQGVLYFRDGTTAGTLKLVVRAGTAGAETTILDNIPQ